MRAAVCLLLCLAVSTFTFAQQELRLGAEETEAIYKKLQQSPLTDDQKQQVRQAIRARDYRTTEVILVRAIDANQKSAELLTLSAGVFLLDKNPRNTAIALKKAERIHPLVAAAAFRLRWPIRRWGNAIGRGRNWTGWPRPSRAKPCPTGWRDLTTTKNTSSPPSAASAA